MKLKKLLITLIIVFSVGFANAQDNLLNQLDTIKSSKKEIETSAFKGLQICNMQSTKMASKGEWYVLISHRFGDLTQGFDNFFGLDNANTKIGTVYGAANWLSLGVSRHTFQKTYELAVKYKLANQEINGFPVTIAGYNTININSELKKVLYPNLEFNDRLAFSSQLLISKKFTNKFSLQVAPIFIHKNLYDAINESKDKLIIASGGRMKVSKRMSVNLEYAAQVNAPKGTNFHNVATVGLDIETGGHVFQMVFSNSQAMNDVTVFTNATGQWNGGSLYFGFNIYRVFN
ncbi:MAG: hypothetical protein H7174_03510 [Flavobacterium sp.]|nr:hypothetical protein [Flavobacterium sp.]